jgi:AmiR/NasT family two-component response regulator
LPILLLTTEVREEKIKLAIDGGITGFIKKPFETQDFLRIVKRAIQ